MRHLICSLLFAFVATAALADHEPYPQADISIYPPAPTTLDEIAMDVKILDFIGPQWTEVHPTEGHDIPIDIHLFCPMPCGTNGIHEYHFARSLGKLEAGTWRIVINLVDGHLDDQEIVFEFEVRQHGTETTNASLELKPATPSESDRVKVLVPYLTEGCQDAPTFDGVDRVGNTFRLGLAIDREYERCPQAGVFGSHLADLGQLPPGDYRLELWAYDRSDENPLPPALVDSQALTVTPTQGAVTLLGRYRTSLTWKTREGQTGIGQPVAGGSNESALFTFFGPNNWEVVAKVLDGCALNGHRWVFAAAATDVEFTLRVDDLQDAAPAYVYHSPGGALVPPLADTAAFACSP